MEPEWLQISRKLGLQFKKLLRRMMVTGRITTNLGYFLKR
jgi:hypothetical protein